MSLTHHLRRFAVAAAVTVVALTAGPAIATAAPPPAPPGDTATSAATPETTSPGPTATEPPALPTPAPTPAAEAPAPPTSPTTTATEAPAAGGLQPAEDLDGGVQNAADPNCTFYPQTGFSVCGAIRDKYNALGGPGGFMGFPTSNELTNPDGAGKRNTFQAGSSIYWSPSTPASQIGGAIFAKWGDFGYESGPLGYPISDELTNVGNLGKRNIFQNYTNMIYWSAATGAHQIGGTILQKWASQGFEVSPLGYPTTDELTAPDGVGRYNKFYLNNGAIYWTPATSAHVVLGAIATHWAELGSERGVLGYPVSDEMTDNNTARHTEFYKGSSYVAGASSTANGSMYWTSQTGAREIHGPVYAKWLTLNAGASCLGYPKVDVQTPPTGQYTQFLNGQVAFNYATGETYYNCAQDPNSDPAEETNPQCALLVTQRVGAWWCPPTSSTPRTGGAAAQRSSSSAALDPVNNYLLYGPDHADFQSANETWGLNGQQFGTRETYVNWQITGKKIVGKPIQYKQTVETVNVIFEGYLTNAAGGRPGDPIDDSRGVYVPPSNGTVPAETLTLWTNGFTTADNSSFDMVQVVQWSWQVAGTDATWYAYAKSPSAHSDTKTNYSFGSILDLPAAPYGGGLRG